MPKIQVLDEKLADSCTAVPYRDPVPERDDAGDFDSRPGFSQK